MTSIAKPTAFVATFALVVTLGISDLQAASGNCPMIAAVNVNGEQIELPTDTAAQVTMLQQFGARYARVIDLILEENAKPEWLFAEDCSREGAYVLATTD